MTTFHQIVVGAGPGDAITQMAFDIRADLRTFGPSEIFARFRDPSLTDDVLTIDELPVGRPGNMLLYHASFGNPEVTRLLLHRPEQLVLIYHNITPSKYFVDDDPAFAAGLEWGRHELTLLRGRTTLNIADSDYNAADLRELGFADVRVIPAGVRPGRLIAETPSSDTVQELHDHVATPFILNVSQLLPHKRQDVLIQAMHLLQWCDGLDLGLVLVGAVRSPSYERALRELVRRLRVRNVWFAGRQGDPALATLFRSAQVFAGASEHEGLGIPPLEAMTFGLPTIVRDAGATAETVGRGALVLPHDAGPMMFAEAIKLVLDDNGLRSSMISGGVDRVSALTTHAEQHRFADLITSALAAR